MNQNYKFHLAIALLIGFLAGLSLGKFSFMNDVQQVVSELEANGYISANEEMSAQKKRQQTVKKQMEARYAGIEMFHGSETEAPYIGKKDAPVTIVEYSDYECPFCGSFHSRALPSLMSSYIKTGKVRLEFKDFPLSFHRNASLAANAARCGGEQQSYWQMHDLIFQGQSKWSGKDQFTAQEVLVGFAEDLSLDKDDFEACLTSGKYGESIQAQMAEGASKGISGTPGFLVGENEEVISGAQPIAVFDKAIKAALGELAEESQ